MCQGVNSFSSAIVPPKILNIILKRAPTEGFVSLAIVDGKVIVSKDNVLTNCPKCNTEVHIKDNFCSYCGEKLHE